MKRDIPANFEDFDVADGLSPTYGETPDRYPPI